MIESSSVSSNTVARSLENRLTGIDAKIKSIAIEKASKVGTEQHQKTMALMSQKAELLLAQKHGVPQDVTTLSNSASSEVSTEETKKINKKNNESNSPLIKSDDGSSSESGGTDLEETDPSKPLDPPKPPRPQEIPPGFALSSLASTKDHHSILTGIMSAMSALITEDAIRQVESNREHQLRTSELNMQSIQKNEVEFTEQQAKAEEAQKAASCVMQIVSVLVTVISVALAVVTGGASAILMAGIGVALLVVDSALQAAGEKSLTDRILSPLMDNVIMPMIEGLGGIISDFLQALGADEAAANIAGTVLALVTIVAAVIASVLIAKNATIIKQFLSKMSDKMFNALSKMTPGVVKAFGKNITSSLDDATVSLMRKVNLGQVNSTFSSTFKTAIDGGDTVAEALKKADRMVDETLAAAQKIASAKIGIVQQSVALGGSAVGTSASVASSTFGYNATLAHEKLQAMFAQMNTNGDLLKSSQSSLSNMIERSNDLMEFALNAQAQEQQTANHILNMLNKGV
ncbi:MAG: type III secretion system translocon subunit SctE [Shewanella sp.]